LESGLVYEVLRFDPAAAGQRERRVAEAKGRYAAFAEAVCGGLDRRSHAA